MQTANLITPEYKTLFASDFDECITDGHFSRHITHAAMMLNGVNDYVVENWGITGMAKLWASYLGMDRLTYNILVENAYVITKLREIHSFEKIITIGYSEGGAPFISEGTPGYRFSLRDSEHAMKAADHVIDLWTEIIPYLQKSN